MRTVILPSVALAFLLSTACGSAKPCTKCAQVAGNYTVTVQSVPAGSSHCDYVKLTGGTETMTVAQSGSNLTLNGPGFTMKGTLYEDKTFAYDPINWDQGTAGHTTADMSGTFYGQAPQWQANGSFEVTAVDYGCSIVADAKWTEQ